MLRKLPIIIDTDIGDDVDDAFALCLAMASPEVSILGVTTVYCDTVKRARIAARLLREGGFPGVPVHAGRGLPLKTRTIYGRPLEPDKTPSGYDAGFDGERIDGGDAVGFIIRTLESAREPVCIVTMGALTNIAAVLTERPDLKKKISFLSVMGGAFNMNVGEYNFCCDPEAASLVLSCGAEIKCAGLDVTFKCSVNGGYAPLLEKAEAKALKTLFKMRKQWGGEVYLHDPLALMSAFDPSYVDWEERRCEVECGASLTNGYVVNLSDWNWRQRPAGNLKVGVGVRADAFTGECMKRILSLK